MKASHQTLVSRLHIRGIVNNPMERMLAKLRVTKIEVTAWA